MQCYSYLISSPAFLRTEKAESSCNHILCHEQGSAAFMMPMEAAAIVEAPNPTLDSLSIKSEMFGHTRYISELAKGADD